MHRLHMRSMLSIVLASALCACTARQAVAEPAHAHAAARAEPSARIRIADGHKRPLELLLPVAAHGRSKVEARSGSAFYRIAVSRDGADAPLHFKIERSCSRGAERNNVLLSVTVRMHRGARAVLARLSRPDGTTTTITAILQ